MLMPDPRQAASMVDDVDARLVAALSYLVSDVLGHPDETRTLSTAPAAHALQALMREAAVENDIDAIRALHAEHGAVLARPVPAERCALVTWGDGPFDASEAYLLQSAFRDDIGLTGALAAPDPDTQARLRAAFGRIRPALAAQLPAWWGEIEALVSTIILASSGTDTARFGGATAFAAWGAVLINPEGQAEPLPLALALVHECSHQKLFYAHLDDEVVLNDPEERFSSPLRRDARPMDGIYHATFVLARMVQFLHDLSRSPDAHAAFGPGVEDEIDRHLRSSIAAFEGGQGEIAAHARLTPKGQEIIDEAAAAVAACKAGLEQNA